jgi:hypothetical protein
LSSIDDDDISMETSILVGDNHDQDKVKRKAWIDQTFQATRGDPAENNNNDYQNENETTNGIEEGE